MRFLVSFHPKRIPHFFTDVLIIGGGLAGLRAANAVGDGCEVLVVTKDKLAQSNSNYAQGGIAGVLAPDDHFENHINDTLVAGGDLCDPEVVKMVVQEGPQRIQELIDWGTQFDADEDGGLVLGKEGGHSHRRIVHANGDATGREVMRAVIAWTRAQEHVTIWENAFTLDLLTDESGCRGAIVAEGDRRTMVWAKQVILCTGGAGQIYRETTNPSVATGDGHALAARAGAELRDMEFIQFHPTVLYIAGSSRSLITEAVRGEGAHLIDRRGDRFMPQYDDRAELAPRDVVSQSIVTQMEKTRHPCVYLTMAHLDRTHVLQRFPGIAKACSNFDLDITTDPIPVRPGAHYIIGGVTVDQHGRTTLPNLWAAGEVTSTGLHGANRLASNSLLEGLVYGARVGEGAADAARAMMDTYHATPMSSDKNKAPHEPLDIADIRNSLQSLMWRSAGVRRTHDDMLEAAEMIDGWRKYVLASEFDSEAGWELQNMLTASQIVIRSALKRTESRGTHLRVDFPDTDPSWQRHVTTSDLDEINDRIVGRWANGAILAALAGCSMEAGGNKSPWRIGFADQNQRREGSNPPIRKIIFPRSYGDAGKT